MDKDYCIENDMGRQQEEAAIAKEKRSKVKLDLLLSFQYVNCAIGNVLTKTITRPSAVGGQVEGMDNPKMLACFSRRQYDDLMESLHILHKQIEDLFE